MPPVQADAVRAYKDRALSDTPDRFDRALAVIAARHEELRSEAAEHVRGGQHGIAQPLDDAADVVSELLVLILADAFERGMPEDVARDRAADTANLLMAAAHDKLTGAGAQ
jgi:hypothetical protein